MEVVGIKDEVLGCRSGVIRGYRGLERSLLGVGISISDCLGERSLNRVP